MPRRGGPKPRPRLDETIERQLAAKVPPGEVVDDVVYKFGITERGAWLAIERVRRSWRQAEASTVESRRAQFRAEMAYAWREALVDRDWRAIAQMGRVVADVEGIRQARKLEVSGTLGLRPAAALTPREREVEIARLLADRAGAQGQPLGLLPDPSRIDPEESFEEVLDPDTPPADLRLPAKKRKAKAKARSRKRSVH